MRLFFLHGNPYDDPYPNPTAQVSDRLRSQLWPVYSASVVTKIITNLVRMCFPTPFVKFLVGTALGFFTNIFASLRINAGSDSPAAKPDPLADLGSEKAESSEDDSRLETLTQEAWSDDNASEGNDRGP